MKQANQPERNQNPGILFAQTKLSLLLLAAILLLMPVYCQSETKETDDEK